MPRQRLAPDAPERGPNPAAVGIPDAGVLLYKDKAGPPLGTKVSEGASNLASMVALHQAEEAKRVEADEAEKAWRKDV